jgi:hypothetical protein
MNWLVLLYILGAFSGSALVAMIATSAMIAHREAQDGKTILTPMSGRVDVESALFRARMAQYNKSEETK